MRKGKVKKKNISKIAECVFIVPAYKRDEEKCNVLIYNGNPHDIEIRIRPVNA